MNIYKILNDITLYIENNLENKISYEKIAKMMGVNEYTMKRIFSVLCGIPLGEYIRKRRLSAATSDLLDKKEKVIDVAIKYQYENATSFSRAFESFHGIKPSKVTPYIKLKEFPRIIFEEKKIINHDIEYSIVELDELILYGTGFITDNKNIKKNAPTFFQSIEKKYQNDYGPIKYGMISYQNNERKNCLSYFVLYDKKIPGLKKITIPKSRYLKFKILSQNAKDIQEMSFKFYHEFLPSCKYNLKETPELEYYHDNMTDFLVPII